MSTRDWKDIKEIVYVKKGTTRRDELKRDFESFKIGFFLKKEREEKQLTQEQLGEILDKKRINISRIENDGSSLTIKSLFDVKGKELGGKVSISLTYKFSRYTNTAFAVSL